MSKKQLPQIKRTLKTFILDEDAKVIDKTATKLAILISFMAINTLINTGDANAKGHGNHTNHSNHVKTIDEDNGNLINNGDETLDRSFTEQGHTLAISMPPKSMASAHGNHYNHSDGGGSS